jgi:hypothetical protein
MFIADTIDIQPEILHTPTRCLYRHLVHYMQMFWGPIQTRPFSLSIILQREMQIMDFEQIPTFQKIVKSDFDQTCVLYYSGWLLCISHSGMYLAIPLFSKRSPQYCHYAQITMKNAFF